MDKQTKPAEKPKVDKTVLADKISEKERQVADKKIIKK